MKKICKYDQNHWLFQDLDKNLHLFNEQTQMLHDLQQFIQPERPNPEDHIVGNNEMICDGLNTMET